MCANLRARTGKEGADLPDAKAPRPQLASRHDFPTLPGVPPPKPEKPPLAVQRALPWERPTARIDYDCMRALLSVCIRAVRLSIESEARPLLRPGLSQARAGYRKPGLRSRAAGRGPNGAPRETQAGVCIPAPPCGALPPMSVTAGFCQLYRCQVNRCVTCAPACQAASPLRAPAPAQRTMRFTSSPPAP